MNQKHILQMSDCRADYSKYCGSRTGGGKARYTKAQVRAMLMACGVSSTDSQNMEELCKNLAKVWADKGMSGSFADYKPKTETAILNYASQMRMKAKNPNAPDRGLGSYTPTRGGQFEEEKLRKKEKALAAQESYCMSIQGKPFDPTKKCATRCRKDAYAKDQVDQYILQANIQGARIPLSRRTLNEKCEYLRQLVINPKFKITLDLNDDNGDPISVTYDIRFLLKNIRRGKYGLSDPIFNYQITQEHMDRIMAKARSLGISNIPLEDIQEAEYTALLPPEMSHAGSQRKTPVKSVTLNDLYESQHPTYTSTKGLSKTELRELEYQLADVDEFAGVDFDEVD